MSRRESNRVFKQETVYSAGLEAGYTVLLHILAEIYIGFLPVEEKQKEEALAFTPFLQHNVSYYQENAPALSKEEREKPKIRSIDNC